MFKHYSKVYVEEELPEACLGCVFMGVDNKLWAGVEKGYVSTQWCNVNGKHLEERYRDRRDVDCPLCKLAQRPIIYPAEDDDYLMLLRELKDGKR